MRYKVGYGLQTHPSPQKKLSSAIYFMCRIGTFSEQTIINVYQNIYNLSYIILETKINFQSAVTFVLVKLNTKFKVQNSSKKRLLLLGRQKTVNAVLHFIIFLTI